LPFGAPLSLYQQASSLVDADKKSEVDTETGLAVFSLTAGITDRAEALEVLRANTVWCCGLGRIRSHLSPSAVRGFRAGKALPRETVLNGARGNYFVSASLNLEPSETKRWHLVADTGLGHVKITALRRRLREDANLVDEIETSLLRARDELWRNVASADGLQRSGRSESWWHHFANVLFNNMRGGVFLHNDEIPSADFCEFLRVRNRGVAERQQAVLESLPTSSTVRELIQIARDTGDADFQRLSYEYLPLYFGRRHGDPSRPWNRFSIRTRNEAGGRELNYEGNWRDIFQNWEALGCAFPSFLPSMVAKFVNASTVDGFNPYRITRDGVDWETVSAEDPWSNIGYWGDHQIIYLLRLLEAMDRYQPDALEAMLDAQIFSYAEVPYRIKPYEAILRDCSSTIEFDGPLEARIEERVRREGTDGKLLRSSDGSVYHANLFEKLLVPALSKLSNLIPDAGIWMNTQRPEWNDANNALAGGGVSVVTLCYLRRYLAFLAEQFRGVAGKTLPLTTEIAEWLASIESALETEQSMLERPSLGASDRKRLMDLLGGAFSDYRARVYAHGFSGRVDVGVQRWIDLCHLALRYIDWGIGANKRPDGLFHSYNLLEITEDEGAAEVVHLQEMLEGQVAALSSGHLKPEEARDVLEALFASALYRPQELSFMLYPERELPGFMKKNVIDASRVEKIPLLKELLEAGDSSVVARDAEGVYRFAGRLRKVVDLAGALDALGERERWAEAVKRDKTVILDLFEDVFHHKSYTGRSGVMYGYEGLGCIYWHMVAKLMLAAQENVDRARREGASASVQDDLARMYFRVRSGIGYEKSVSEYGAFPTDPYSHTTPQGGAKQPGMTGQVKEEVLTRIGELGVHVEKGVLHFQPVLLQPWEFLDRSESFCYVDVHGNSRSIALSAGSLAFTLCQVPVVYEQVEHEPWIAIGFADGGSTRVAGTTLDGEHSAELFSRSGSIELIRVGIADRGLCEDRDF
jgi:hypothetical protein